MGVLSSSEESLQHPKQLPILLKYQVGENILKLLFRISPVSILCLLKWSMTTMHTITGGGRYRDQLWALYRVTAFVSYLMSNPNVSQRVLPTTSRWSLYAVSGPRAKAKHLYPMRKVKLLLPSGPMWASSRTRNESMKSPPTLHSNRLISETEGVLLLSDEAQKLGRDSTEIFLS